MFFRSREYFKVLTEVSDKEGEWEEENSDCGEDLHGFVLVGAHHVEDEVDEVVGCAAHLVERGSYHDAVVFYVAEVGVREGRDGDGGYSFSGGDGQRAVSGRCDGV